MIHPTQLNPLRFFFGPPSSSVLQTLSSMLSWRAHGSVGLRSWIFYTITPCYRAFHMTSIVVSLYFKQENCETLISLYNWGRMKRCQSQLVSCKVEWFCSLAGFSRWPGLSSFLPASVAQLCARASTEERRKRLYWRRPEVRVALLEPITALQVHGQYLLHAFPHAVLLQPPSLFTPLQR